MHFANMNGIWLLSAAIVIILMYVLKRKYEDQVVSSHLLWNRVMQELEVNRPWQKLKRSLLLLLQLLVACLIVLAFMQPSFWNEGAPARHAVLVVDRSASLSSTAAVSAQSDNGQTRLDQLIAQAKEWLRQQQAEEYTLIVNGAQTEVVVASSSSAANVSSALEKLKPYYGETDNQHLLSYALARTSLESDVKLVFFTDGQQLPDWQQLDLDHPVEVILPQAENEHVGQNRWSVGAFAVKPQSGQIRGTALIYNYASAKSKVEASVFAGNELYRVFDLTLDGESADSLFLDDLPQADYYAIELSSDPYRADNKAYAFADSEENHTALLLSEGNLFLEKALQLAGVQVIKLQPQAGSNTYTLPEVDVDMLILDRVSEVNLEQGQWQTVLNEKPVWLIDSLISGEKQLPENGEYSLDQQHPLIGGITLQDAHIQSVTRVNRYPWQGLAAIGSMGNMPLFLAGEHNGVRKLVYTFALQDTDLPLRPEFPVLVYYAARWLVGDGDDALGSKLVNSEIDISFSAETAKAYWHAMPMTGLDESADTEGMPVNIAADPINTPVMPGLYQLREENDQGQLLRQRWLHVFADPRESIPGASVEAGEPLVIPADGVNADAVASAQQDRQSLHAVPWLALLILVLLAVEWGVYQRGD